MPQYKIIDYNFTTAAELARAILEYVGVQYEDVRFEKEKAGDAEKATPFGNLPVLEVEGKIIAQHQSICRYLAREHDLVGKDNVEAALSDLVMDGLWHMFAKIRRAQIHQISREERSAIISKMISEDVPKYLNGFESLLKNRKDENNYIVGKEVTWGDIGLTLALAALKYRYELSLEPYPQLQGYLHRMMDVPQLAEFLAKRAQEEAGY